MSRTRGDEPPSAGAPMEDAELLSDSPFDDDLDTALAAARPQRPSLPGPTLYLAAGILLVAGFLGGVQAQKWSSDGSGSPGAGPAAAGGYGGGRAAGGYGGMPGGGPPGGMPGGTGPGGFTGGRGGAAGDITTGTVVKITGSTLYLRTTSGDTVKVATSGTTQVRITEEGTLKDLTSGATVIVRGTKAKDGTVTATTLNKGSAR